MVRRDGLDSSFVVGEISPQETLNDADLYVKLVQILGPLDMSRWENVLRFHSPYGRSSRGLRSALGHVANFSRNEHYMNGISITAFYPRKTEVPIVFDLACRCLTAADIASQIMYYRFS